MAPPRMLEKEGHKPASHGAYRLVDVEADLAFQKFLLEDILPDAAPDFAKSTEDGAVSHIYRIGSQEIRTTQEQGGPETVGKMVFSPCHLLYSTPLEIPSQDLWTFRFQREEDAGRSSRGCYGLQRPAGPESESKERAQAEVVGH